MKTEINVSERPRNKTLKFEDIEEPGVYEPVDCCGYIIVVDIVEDVPYGLYTDGDMMVEPIEPSAWSKEPFIRTDFDLEINLR